MTGGPAPPAVDHAHNPTDPHDSHSLVDRAKAEKKEEELEDKQRAARLAEPATAAAKKHGNEPSRGAKIDEELAKADEEELRKKDARK